MANNNQLEQLKGYARAVEELSLLVATNMIGQPTIVKNALSDIQNEMRGKVVRLTNQLEDSQQ